MLKNVQAIRRNPREWSSEVFFFFWSGNSFGVRGNSVGAMATSVTHCQSRSLFVSLPLLSLWWVCTPETCLFSNKTNIATSYCHSRFPSPSSHQLLHCSWSTPSFFHVQACCCQNTHAKLCILRFEVISCVQLYKRARWSGNPDDCCVSPRQCLKASFRLVDFNYANQRESVAHPKS